MSVKNQEMFGQFLIKKDLISIDQLEEALQYQVTFGGRLGTNLVELGHLRLNDLAEQLGVFLGMEKPPKEWSGDIPPKILGLVPKELAKKYKVVPLHADGPKIHVAMIEPQNPQQIDELAFATGRRVIPYVIPELRMHYWLEKFYDIKRDIRYINIERDIMKKRFDTPQINTKKRSAKGANPDSPFQEQGGNELTEETMEVFDAQIGSMHGPSKANIPDAVGPEAGQAAPAPEAVSKEAAAAAALEAAAAEANPSYGEYIHEFEKTLLNATSREQIMTTALDLARIFVETAALFVVYKGMVQGYAGRGSSLNALSIDGILLPVETPSMITSPVRSGTFFHGNPSDSSLDERFLAAMQRSGVDDVMALPIRIKDRVVNVLYVDNGQHPIPSVSQEALKGLSKRLEEAYVNLILRLKNQMS